MKTFFLGLGFGAVAGVLFAPKRGDVTRAELRQNARDWTRDLANSLSKWTNRQGADTATRKPQASVKPKSTGDNIESDAQVLNTATREALIAVHGIGQVLAERIIQNRPYKKAYEVVEKGILAESTFTELRRELLETSA